MTAARQAREDMPLRSTINDVARAAGVSTSTVSRALSHPGRVNARTRALVVETAGLLDYTPRARTSGRKPVRAGLIAVVVPEIDDPFFLDVIRMTQVPLRTAGYYQLVLDTGNSTELEWDSLQSLRNSVDGVILVASRLPDEQLRAIADVLPLVALNRSTDGVACVLIDTQSGTVQALEHLVSLGHRCIGYVGGPLSSWSSASRLRALQERSTELGVEIVTVGAFEAKVTSGATAADIAVNAGVTACICFGDLIAIGMLQRFRDQDVGVPSDFSVVGCDDAFGADFCAPPLTTLTVPTEQATRVAMDMLLAEIGANDNKPIRTTSILQTHLTIRESTGQSPRFPRQRSGWAAFAEADAEASSRASATPLLGAPRGHQPGA